jgi:hypothetical protein
MSKRPYILAASVALGSVLILVACIWWFWFSPPSYHSWYWQEIRTGNEVVRRVESYRLSHGGRMPETAEDVGLDEEKTRIYYGKFRDNHYEVSFLCGPGFFGREIYSSSTKKWFHSND